MTGGADSWKTNDPYSAGVAAALAGIEKDMGWVKDALKDGKQNSNLQSQAIEELKGIARDLTNAVKTLTEERKEIEALEERLRQCEQESALNRDAMKRWKQIHDTFVATVLKWVLGTALTAAAAAAAAVRVAR